MAKNACILNNSKITPSKLATWALTLSEY